MNDFPLGIGILIAGAIIGAGIATSLIVLAMLLAKAA